MANNAPWSDWSQVIHASGLDKMGNYWSQQAGLVNIYNMSSEDRSMEQEIIEGVGGYGRQLGWLLDAMDVLINRLENTKHLQDLTHEENNALEQVKTLKHRVDSIRERRRG